MAGQVKHGPRDLYIGSCKGTFAKVREPRKKRHSVQRWEPLLGLEARFQIQNFIQINFCVLTQAKR